MNKSYKRGMVPFFIIAIITILGAVGYVYTKKQSPQDSTVPTETNNPSQETSKSAEVSAISIDLKKTVCLERGTKGSYVDAWKDPSKLDPYQASGSNKFFGNDVEYKVIVRDVTMVDKKYVGQLIINGLATDYLSKGECVIMDGIYLQMDYIIFDPTNNDYNSRVGFWKYKDE